MSEYRPLHSPFGLLWLHRCAALNHGPEWTRRERLLIDAGATDSRLTFRGRSIPFHGHLFKEADGQFRFTERDNHAYPPELLDELEDIANRALI
jgi:hypothetical protein